MVSPIDVSDEPSIENLQKLISALRSEQGCPWDRKQTPSTLTVYLIEEIFELVEAVETDDTDAIREELGDVLFQVFFITTLYMEMGRISLETVLKHNLRKMIRRHPHVFGAEQVDSALQVKERWRQIKREEKSTTLSSILDSVPSGLPALLRAFRISERAAGIGFDWQDLFGVIKQTESEWAEFTAEIASDDAIENDRSKMAMELGDVFFSLVNVARLAGIHPETALSRSTQKFIRRFKAMETMAQQNGQALEKLSRAELERLWNKAKSSSSKI